MSTRRRELRRDPKGCFRLYIGWKTTDGKRIEHRFNLGNDEREAQCRYAAIQRLHEEVTAATGNDTWTDDPLALAKQIEKGQQTLKFDPPKLDHFRFRIPSSWLSMPNSDNFDCAPSLPRCSGGARAPTSARPSATMAVSVAQNGAFVAERIRQLRAELEALGCLAASQAVTPVTLIQGTFHEALDAYKAQVERDGERLPSGKLKPYSAGRLKRADRLKEHHQDRPDRFPVSARTTSPAVVND